MKRTIGILVGLSLAVAAFAQAPFTIVRPYDNAKVREKVRVQIPKNSVPQGGYIGIFVGGKFVEALVPSARGNFYEYVLDTKGRGIPDGNLKVEAVLYMDADQGTPRILDRSSINVKVQNSASIKVPASGLLLRYGFKPSTEYVYRHVSRSSVSLLTDAQRQSGGRAAELPLDYDVIRLRYSVDTTYGNGDGLVRLMAIPPKGKDHLYYNAVLEGETDSGALWMENQMAPLYMRLKSTGQEVFGSMPNYYGIEGSGGQGGNFLYITRPLPTLPSKRVKPGDSWASRFQLGKDLDKSKLHEATSVIQRLPARGEFVGVEWEMGHPCAKLRNSIATGTRRLPGMSEQAGQQSVSLEEIVWFALDKKVVVKSVINMTIDAKVDGAGGAAAGGAQGTQPSGSGGKFERRGVGDDDEIKTLRPAGQQGMGGGSDTMGGVGSAPPPQGGRGNFGQGQGAGRGPGATAQWQRIRSQIIMVLEK